jgi:uncharacterized peroxidase-related enzyme
MPAEHPQKEPHVPHIDLDNSQPGILGLLKFRPDTGAALLALTDLLLHGPGSLPPGDRELIAALVSRRNECSFCQLSHGASAAAQLPDGAAMVSAVLADPATAPVSALMKALLAIAAAVQHSGSAVTDELVGDAKEAGATDLQIHDTVLIAAAFCMFNRYVDGLATESPTDPAVYAGMGAQLAEHGYTL